jgi:hypothetical protein
VVLTRQEIADAIETVARSSFEGDKLAALKTAGDPTKAVKKVFGDLGNRLGYFVAARGYHEKGSGGDGEWLYDMTWYAGDTGEFTQLALALESEMGPVDSDFHKLVQAHAEVRVWVSRYKNAAQAAEHIGKCKRLAASFPGALSGDTYILIVWDAQVGNTTVERFVVP